MRESRALFRAMLLLVIEPIVTVLVLLYNCYTAVGLYTSQATHRAMGFDAVYIPYIYTYNKIAIAMADMSFA